MKSPRAISILTAGLLALSSILPNKSPACTGAAQIAAGGTGVTTAENSHCAYWNPAISAELEKPEFSYTKLIGGDEKFRYNDVFSFASPVGERFGVSAQFTHSATIDDFSRQERWDTYAIGAGFRFSDKSWPFQIFLGTNIRDNQIMRRGMTRIFEKKEYITLDKSFLIEGSNIFFDDDVLRFGVLWQSFNKKDVSLLRPEIAYKKNRTIIVFGLYPDRIKKGDSEEKRLLVRAGIEQKLGDFSLRLGYGELNSATRKNLTAGIGYEFRNFGDFGDFGVNLATTQDGMTLFEFYKKF